MHSYMPLLFILCSYFYLLFLSLLATRHTLQFTMFDSISLQPAHNITEIRKTLHKSTIKEKVLIITKTNALI